MAGALLIASHGSWNCEEDAGVLTEVFDAVTDKNTVDIILCNVGAEICAEIAQIDNMQL